jgi:hypothetical protein
MGNRNVGSGKTVNLSVRTSGIDNGESATIEIFKKEGDEALDTLTASVSEGKVTTDWTAKGPGEDDDEQSWEIYYKVKCKGLETKGKPMTIFTDWVEITSVDEDDQALPDAEFQISVGSDRRDRNTGSSGVRKEEHLPGPGKVKIKWLEPYELIEWVDEDGPKRKAKVRRIETAKLVFPEKGEHTQWTNQETDENEPGQGSLLKVKVTLIEAKAGAKGYAKVIFGDENSKRNDPKPELVGGSQTDWCEEGELGLEFELAGDDGTPDCEAVFDLEVGLAGCDTVTLMVGGTTDCADEKVVITTTRKIYYQLTHFAEVAPLDACKAALKDVGIDYEEYSDVEIAEADPPAGAFIDGESLQAEGKLLVVGDHNFDWFKGKFQDDKAPLGAHVILCDQQYDGGDPGAWHEQTLEAEAEFAKKTFVITDPYLYDVFPTSIQDGESSVLSGSTWESLAPSGHPDNGKSGPITGDDCVFGVARTPDRVQVVLPDDAKAIVGDGELSGDQTETDENVKHKVKITLKLHVARGPFMGASDGVHQLIVKVPNEARFNEVLVHELAHSLGETLSEVPPGLSKDDHGREYTGKEHQGHHCGFGLSDDEFASDDLSMSTSGRCAMFGSGEADQAPQSGGGFCKLCEPFVRANQCTSLEGAKGKMVWVGDVDDETDVLDGALVKIKAADGESDPALTLDVSGSRTFKATVKPEIAGTWQFECEHDAVTLTPNADSVDVVMAEDAAEDESITLTAKIMSDATGEIFESTHTFKYKPKFRFLEAEESGGETQNERELAPAGTGEDEDDEDYVAYSGEVLSSIYSIHQDAGDSDCGPTSACFLRMGGAQRDGAPMEGGRQATGGTIQDLCEKMRAETGAPTDHSQGTYDHEMVNVLDEFAAIWDGRHVAWTNDEQEFNTDEVDNDDIRKWYTRCVKFLRSSPRGVLCNFLSTRPGAKEGDTGTYHWVVLVGIDSKEVRYYDPGSTNYGLMTMPTLDFLSHHVSGSFTFVENLKSPGMIYAARDTDAPVIKRDTVICEVDEGATTWGQDLKAAAAATWFNNPAEADALAEKWAKSDSVAVLEVPPGSFAVCKLQPISDANAEGGGIDHSGSDDAFIYKYPPASIQLRLRASNGDVRVREYEHESSTHRT